MQPNLAQILESIAAECHRLHEQLDILYASYARPFSDDTEFLSSLLVGHEGCALIGKPKMFSWILCEELIRLFPAIGFEVVQGKSGHLSECQSGHYWLVSADRSIALPPCATRCANASIMRRPFFETDGAFESAHYSEEPLEDEFGPIELWRCRLRGLQRKWVYRQELHKLTIYVVGGALSGKDAIATYLHRTLGTAIVDSAMLFRVVTYRLLNRRTANPIAADLSLLNDLAHRDTETDRVVDAIRKSMGFVRRTLAEIDSAILLPPTSAMLDMYHSNQVSSLVALVASVPEVKSAVTERLVELVRSVKRSVLTGYTFRDIDVVNFTTVNLVVSEYEASRRLQCDVPGLAPAEALERIRMRNVQDLTKETMVLAKSLDKAIVIDTSMTTPSQAGRRVLRGLIKLTQRESIERREQVHRQILRGKFKWPINPLIERLRSEGNSLVESVAHDYESTGLSPMDLSIQTAIHLCAHPVEEVWHGDDTTISQMVRMVREQSDELDEFAMYQFDSFKLRLNQNLFRAEVERQAIRLDSLHKFLAQDCGFDLLELVKWVSRVPAPTAKAEPFRRGQLKMHSRHTRSAEGVTYWTGRDSSTGHTVVCRPVASDISRVYMKALHYLHEARDDETAAFGMFLKGKELPFALVSFSPVNREYKRDMLRYLGIESTSCLEFSRGWNACWAPVNTLSCLFAYAYDSLEYRAEQQLRRNEVASGLKAIVTAINPNIGFKGRAFSGAFYVPVGLKPATFTYIRSPDGECTYRPRREIQRLLSINNPVELRHHQSFQTSHFPMASTVEMIAMKNQSDRVALMQKPIYVIQPEQYRY